MLSWNVLEFFSPNIFDLQLVEWEDAERMDVERMDAEGPLYLPPGLFMVSALKSACLPIPVLLCLFKYSKK